MFTNLGNALENFLVYFGNLFQMCASFNFHLLNLGNNFSDKCLFLLLETAKALEVVKVLICSLFFHLSTLIFTCFLLSTSSRFLQQTV